MSKKAKKEPEPIKDIFDEEVNQTYARLSLLITKYNISLIQVDYSGSGDSGDINKPEFTYNPPEAGSLSPGDVDSTTNDEIHDICSNIIFQLVEPDFNNDGSSGNAKFYIDNDGKLKFECEHSDYYQESKESSYNEDLLDTSFL